MFKIYGEDYAYLLAEIRNRGYRHMWMMSPAISARTWSWTRRTYALEAVIDKFVVKHPGARDGRRDLRYDIEQAIVTSIQNGLRVGEGLCGSGLPGLRQKNQNREPGARTSDEVDGSRFSVLGSNFFTGFACTAPHDHGRAEIVLLRVQRSR